MKIRVALFAAAPVYHQAPLRRIAADPRIDFTAIFASNSGATRPYNDGVGLDAITLAVRKLMASSDLQTQFRDASRRIIAPRTYGVTAAGVVAATRAVGEARWALAEPASESNSA